MIEPRLTSIVLLDGSQLDFLITPDFLTCDLLDMVCAHLSLNDKEYFGLSFIDHTGHRNWLQMEKKILDHDLAKKNGILILFFSVKFFIESIAYTKDKNAVELFFLQSRLLIYQGDLELNNELIFELGALVLQSLFGDFKNDKETIQNIKNQNILPKHFFANYNQVSSYCEPKIISYYKKCATLNRGQCIVNYLSIVEKLCNYGVHYYEVKDKTSTKWYLGVSYRGIGLYEANNKIIPKKIFPWSKLENLYYRDRKFSIEVHESQSVNSGNTENEFKNILQTQSNPQQTDEAFNPVKVYAWFASIPSLCKSIWLMAVAQHQFYLDKKQNRHNVLQFKSLNDLATELNSNTNSNGQQKKFNVENLENNMTNGIKLKPPTNSKLINGQKTNEENTKTELLSLFKKQKEILQKRLEIKKKLYENVKTKQKDIQDIAQQALNDKTQINKLLKILADFRNNNLNANSNRDKNILIDNICQESDIQKKIMFITLNLASDPHVSYIVQKQRREFYEKIKKKLNKLEKRLEKETITPKDMFLDSKSNSQNDKHETFHHCSSEVKLKQIDDSSADISPASIHRKDSYRRAQEQRQEQKLFLDSGDLNNINKNNRLVAARKVKTILNSDTILNQGPTQTQSHTQLIPIQQNMFIENNLNGQSENQVRVIKIGNNFKNNFIPEEQVSNGLLIEGKPKVENQENRKFYIQEELDYDLRNYNPNQTNSLNHHSNQNLPQTDFITFRNQRNSRKNTSDSNVKLLADHNFYHVTNRRHVNHEFQSRESFACPDLVEPNSCLIKNGFITHPNKLISNKPYELTDYFKYNSKFKRGMNSSSNSLISLNSSSAGTNEDSGNNNSDKDVIRSNPDLKMNGLGSPNSVPNQSYVIHQIKNQNSIKNLTQLGNISSNGNLNNSCHNLLNDQLNQKYDYYSNQSFKSDLTNLSNNLSLNLSIHTAEEFGIEMLEWLNNETTNANSLIDSKLTTNATLV